MFHQFFPTINTESYETGEEAINIEQRYCTVLGKSTIQRIGNTSYLCEKCLSTDCLVQPCWQPVLYTSTPPLETNFFRHTLSRHIGNSHFFPSFIPCYASPFSTPSVPSVKHPLKCRHWFLLLWKLQLNLIIFQHGSSPLQLRTEHHRRGP